MDFHILFAVFGGVVGAVGYVLYLRSVFAGATRPHVFTWLVYVLIDALVFFIQLFEAGGPGAWVTFVGVVGNSAIALSCFRYGERRISVSDWISFASALGGVLLWQLADNPLLAVVLVTITNSLAVFPTLRKSYASPHEESITIWSLDLVRFSFGLFALSSLSLTTALFPIGVLITNGVLISTILIRRRQIK